MFRDKYLQKLSRRDMLILSMAMLTLFLGFYLFQDSLPMTPTGMVIYEGIVEGNVTYIPFDSGLYYKLNANCSFAITDSVGGQNLRLGTVILDYQNTTTGVNYSTTNFTHLELYNQSNTIFHKSCHVGSCFIINITVTATENGGVEEQRIVEKSPQCSDVKILRHYGGISSSRPTVNYPFGTERSISTAVNRTYPFDIIFAPVIVESSSMNGVYSLIGANATVVILNISKTGYGMYVAALNPAGDYILTDKTMGTFFYYASSQQLNYSKYYRWFSVHQNSVPKEWNRNQIENVSFQFSKPYQLNDFNEVGYTPQICQTNMCDGRQFKWGNVQTMDSDELDSWLADGANYSMIVKNSDGSNSTFAHWNGSYYTFNMNPAWAPLRTIFFERKVTSSGFSAFFDDMEDVRKDYEPSIRYRNDMSTLQGFTSHAQSFKNSGLNILANQWIPKIHPAIYQDDYDIENAEMMANTSYSWTPDEGDTIYWSAKRTWEGVQRQERLMEVARAFSAMVNPPLLTKRSMISYEHYDSNYGIAAAVTKQLKVPSSYSLTTRGAAINTNDSFIIARYQMNDHELPVIDSFDYFINDSYGAIPFGHNINITLYKSPVVLTSTAKYYQFDNNPIQTVLNGQITLSGSVGPGHTFKAWKTDLRITSRSGIYFLLGKPVANGLYIEGVSTDWYPYPDGNTNVQINYVGNFFVFDFKQNDIIAFNGSLRQNIAGQDYKKAYLFFNFTNITLTESSARIFGPNLINTTTKLTYQNTSNSSIKTVSSNLSIEPNVSIITSANCSFNLITMILPNASTRSITAYACANNILNINLSVPKGISTLKLESACTPDNQCSAWSGCSNSSQSRTCDNQCGSITVEHQSCSCVESWDCTSWTACSGNTQTRSCADLNSCGTTLTKPEETLACSSTPASGGNSGGGSGGSPVLSKLDYLRGNQSTKPPETKPAAGIRPVETPNDTLTVVDEETPAGTFSTQVNTSTATAAPAIMPEQQAPVRYAKGVNIKLSIVAASVIFIIVLLWTVGFLESSKKYILPVDKKLELHGFISSQLNENQHPRDIKRALHAVGWKRMMVRKEMKEVIKAQSLAGNQPVKPQGQGGQVSQEATGQASTGTQSTPTAAAAPQALPAQPVSVPAAQEPDSSPNSEKDPLLTLDEFTGSG